jgi:hypothetical protein
MTQRLVASNISDGQMIFEISRVPLARRCFIGCKPRKSLDRNVRVIVIATRCRTDRRPKLPREVNVCDGA